MHSARFPPSEVDSHLNRNYVFKLLVAYEDFITGKRAKETCDTIIRDLGPDYTFHFDLWKFDVLELSQLRKIAAHDAAEADMIIIAAHGKEGLSPAVKSWIDMWAPHKRDSALVAMLDQSCETGEESSLIHSYLKDVAVRSGMDFFWEAPEEYPSGCFGNAREKIAARAGTVSSLLEGILNQRVPPSHWGINE